MNVGRLALKPPVMRKHHNAVRRYITKDFLFE